MYFASLLQRGKHTKIIVTGSTRAATVGKQTAVYIFYVWMFIGSDSWIVFTICHVLWRIKAVYLLGWTLYLLNSWQGNASNQCLQFIVFELLMRRTRCLRQLLKYNKYTTGNHLYVLWHFLVCTGNSEQNININNYKISKLSSIKVICYFLSIFTHLVSKLLL